MTLRLISDLSSGDLTVTLEGFTYPAQAVVEDHDGVRALLLASVDTAEPAIPAHLWVQAHSLGAEYIVLATDAGVFMQLTEDFVARRREDLRTGLYRTAMGDWTQVEEVSYREFVLAQAEAAQAAPEVTSTFVHLHTHSEYSALDGLSTIPEMIETVMADGQGALAVTDHFNCAAHPELGRRCAEAGIKPIFGMEANLVEDRHRRGRSWFVLKEDGIEYEVEDVDSLRPELQKKVERRSDAHEVLNGYEHITLWAMNETGLRNIWAMSTESYREGFYGRPRLDYDTLARHSEGVLASTGCLRGPLARPLTRGKEDQALINVGRLMEIFPDRLYVEIHTNHLEEQIKANADSVRIARAMGLPMIAAVDSHYAKPEDRETHRSWLAIQQDKDSAEEGTLFGGGQDYHLKTEAEVREALLANLPADVVEECIATTATLAARCDVSLGADPAPPTYSRATADHPDPVQRDVERLIDLCLSNWERKVVGKKHPIEVYEARFEREMRLLIAKMFCGYFLVVADYVNWAKSQGCLVGPGRGSGGGSLVAYLAGITELDPVEHDLIFERFLTEGRTSLPDFDVDFPTSWRPRLKAYVIKRWGEDYVLTIGTVTRLQPKGAINDAARVMKAKGYEMPWAAAEPLRKAIDEAVKAAAGTKVLWEDIAIQNEHIVDPLRQTYPEIMGLAEQLMGRVRSYGKHPAGVVVSTGAPLTDLPMRVDDDGNLISQFDMNALEMLGYVKFDLLTLRTLDTIQECVDLIEAKYGRRVNVYDWREEYTDPQVWDEVSAGHTLGVFQIETKSGTRMVKRVKPRSVDDLADDITIVRPGPLRSGLTETFLKRRNGEEAVAFPDPRLEAVLGPTYGAPIYQEQVMAICMVLAGYDENKADEVRKILGKKKVELVESAGREFIEAAVERGMYRGDAEHLWSQLAEFAKYGFGKAHAYGYAVLGHWCAWLKAHFPMEFLTAALSTIDAARHPDFIAESRRIGYKIERPDINESKVHFWPEATSVRYGLADVKGIGEPTAEELIRLQPFTSLQDFRERALAKGSLVDTGHLKALVKVGAFDALVPNRRAVEMELEREASGEAKKCIFKDLQVVGPGGLPCTFDWANEPDPPLVSKGRGKDKTFVPKPPPKQCNVKCRNYTPPGPLDVSLIQPYTLDDIMATEREILGVYLSATPFDRLDPADLAALHTTADVEEGPIDAEYIVAATVEGLRLKEDTRGGQYAFVTLNAQNGLLDAICFSSTFSKVKQHVRKDALVFAVLWKTDKGVQISHLTPAL